MEGIPNRNHDLRFNDSTERIREMSVTLPAEAGVPPGAPASAGRAPIADISRVRPMQRLKRFAR